MQLQKQASHDSNHNVRELHQKVALGTVKMALSASYKGAMHAKLSVQHRLMIVLCSVLSFTVAQNSFSCLHAICLVAGLARKKAAIPCCTAKSICLPVTSANVTGVAWIMHLPITHKVLKGHIKAW